MYSSVLKGDGEETERIAAWCVVAILSVLGAYIGRKSGTWLGSGAEALGGLVLIAIGVNMVV